MIPEPRGRFYSRFGLVDSDQECRFLAFFEDGVTLGELLEQKVLGCMPMSCLSRYLALHEQLGLIHRGKKEGIRGYPISLTPDGLKFQDIAKHMWMADVWIRNHSSGNHNYLNVFFGDRRGPQQMFEVLYAIFKHRRILQMDWPHQNGHSQFIRRRLDSFGLVTSERDKGYMGVATRVTPTRAGELYFDLMINPVLEFLSPDRELRKQSLVNSTLPKWHLYTTEAQAQLKGNYCQQPAGER